MPGARVFDLPDLGEGLTEAEIVRWLVGPGERIEVDQPVVEVETAKTAVEVPAPFAGTVLACHGRPGEALAVGAPLITIGAPDAVLVGSGVAEAPRRRRRRVLDPVAAEPPRGALRGAARAAAERLTRSHREIPAATTWVDVDATDFVALRDALRANGSGPGLLAMLARLCVLALGRYPELNATVDGQDIVRSAPVHLGFAAQTGRGLVVPVVRDAGALGLAGLATELARLTTAARAGALAPAELTGGTFTLNNYGPHGVDGAVPLLNHPEGGMLGVGRLCRRPWVVDGAVVPRQVMQLALTFDHRLCDGAAAAGLLRFVADGIERPGDRVEG